MNPNRAINYKDLLLSYLALKADYNPIAGLRKKILLVEGATDFDFIGCIIINKAKVIKVNDFMRARRGFSSYPSQEVDRYNCKNVITTILRSISLYPVETDFPKGAEKWPLFGLVDKDFGDTKDYRMVKKLFVTDTHDIETLMLSTDEDLIFRLEQCSITKKDFMSALYIAEQLAELRQSIFKYNSRSEDNDNKLNTAKICSSDGTVDYEMFTNGDRISLVMLLRYINSNMENPISWEKLASIQDIIMQDLKGFLDKDGYWEKDIEDFTKNRSIDFWTNVNGHDILSAICYKNINAKNMFHNQGPYRQEGLNREFEIALYKKYNYDCLKRTKLYQRLGEAGLLKS